MQNDMGRFSDGEIADESTGSSGNPAKVTIPGGGWECNAKCGYWPSSKWLMTAIPNILASRIKKVNIA